MTLLISSIFEATNAPHIGFGGALYSKTRRRKLVECGRTKRGSLVAALGSGLTTDAVWK
jgi:hypothetical protein